MKHNRIVLLAIAMLFFGPLLLAMLMHSNWWRFEPQDTVNAGRLVQPPVQLLLSELEVLDAGQSDGDRADETWWMLFVYESECTGACLREVTGLRQVHLALGRNRQHVRIGLVSKPNRSAETGRQLKALYPRFVQLGAHGFDAFQAAAGEYPPRHGFLLDPGGNIIMAYAPGFDPNDIMQDLKRLLTWSAQDS